MSHLDEDYVCKLFNSYTNNLWKDINSNFVKALKMYLEKSKNTEVSKVDTIM